jgi:hypothetical protein
MKLAALHDGFYLLKFNHQHLKCEKITFIDINVKNI